MIQTLLIYMTMIVCLLFWSYDISAITPKHKEYAVIRVIDGDGAIVIGRNNKKKEIRLAYIDAPEFKQQYGLESKKALTQLINRQIVRIKFTGKKSYGRYIAIVYLDGEDINKLMVADGHAWVEPRYNKSRAYLKAQRKAKIRRLGLWRNKKPMPPWVWRRIFGKY